MTICSVADCGRRTRSNGYCKTHYEQWRKTGDTWTFKPRDGLGCIHKGYRIISRPGHPNANANGVISEHRFVMSELLGRPLRPHENVHHRNGDKLDNRPDNLELWIVKQPYGQRLEDLTPEYGMESC